MVGSHVFDATPLTIDETTIENGYFVTRKRPSEGMRMVYIPKDSSDLDFVPQTFKLSPEGPVKWTSSVPIYPFQWFDNPYNNPD